MKPDNSRRMEEHVKVEEEFDRKPSSTCTVPLLSKNTSTPTSCSAFLFFFKCS
jgi:hypothetical protein